MLIVKNELHININDLPKEINIYMSEEKNNNYQRVNLATKKLRRDLAVELKGVSNLTRIGSLNSKAVSDIKNGHEINTKYDCLSYDLILATNIYSSWLTLPPNTSITFDDYAYRHLQLILNLSKPTRSNHERNK